MGRETDEFRFFLLVFGEKVANSAHSPSLKESAFARPDEVLARKWRIRLSLPV